MLLGHSGWEKIRHTQRTHTKHVWMRVGTQTHGGTCLRDHPIGDAALLCVCATLFCITFTNNPSALPGGMTFSCVDMAACWGE